LVRTQWKNLEEVQTSCYCGRKPELVKWIPLSEEVLVSETILDVSLTGITFSTLGASEVEWYLPFHTDLTYLRHGLDWPSWQTRKPDNEPSSLRGGSDISALLGDNCWIGEGMLPVGVGTTPTSCDRLLENLKVIGRKRNKERKTLNCRFNIVIPCRSLRRSDTGTMFWTGSQIIDSHNGWWCSSAGEWLWARTEEMRRWNTSLGGVLLGI